MVQLITNQSAFNDHTKIVSAATKARDTKLLLEQFLYAFESFTGTRKNEVIHIHKNIHRNVLNVSYEL